MSSITPLLASKLYIPRAQPNRVARPRLYARLNAAHALTLLCAPPGFGKTTLLGEWIPSQAQCVCWLSLDDGDSDPVRFWTYFIAALQTLNEKIGATALALLHAPQPLPLARWRARGRLGELRAADLRFTPDETAAFLNGVMGLHLIVDEVAALAQHTEGWIAGLQLAALSMQDRLRRAVLAPGYPASAGRHNFVPAHATVMVRGIDRRTADVLSLRIDHDRHSSTESTRPITLHGGKT